VATTQHELPDDGLVELRRAVLISPNAEMKRSVIRAIAGRMEVLECSGPDGYSDPDTVLGQTPDLCLIEVGSDWERAQGLVRNLSDAGLAVVALHVTNDSDLILRSLRSGASEFLSAPIESGQLWQTFERLIRRNTVGKTWSRRGRIWMVMPARANYGATTISCNLAVRLKRLEPRRVLLADMDLLVGSVGFSLKLKSPFSVLDAMADCSVLDAELWRKLTVSHCGIDVLLGPDEPQLDPVDTPKLALLFQFWRETYGITILDSPGADSSWQIALAAASDELLLVVTNELPAVHAAQKILRHLEASGIPKSHISLILNRYNRENGLTEDAVQTALRVDVCYVLPNDYVPVQKAVLEGKTVPPDCRLGKAIDELCERLTGVTKAPKKTWLSTMSGRFSKT
jgi:Flp pilus assembly CpaE family ATPase